MIILLYVNTKLQGIGKYVYIFISKKIKFMLNAMMHKRFQNKNKVNRFQIIYLYLVNKIIYRVYHYLILVDLQKVKKFRGKRKLI